VLRLPDVVGRVAPRPPAWQDENITILYHGWQTKAVWAWVDIGWQARRAPEAERRLRTRPTVAALRFRVNSGD
jgi:hypothetical protein